jgi:hypothetical protein
LFQNKLLKKRNFKKKKIGAKRDRVLKTNNRENSAGQYAAKGRRLEPRLTAQSMLSCGLLL